MRRSAMFIPVLGLLWFLPDPIRADGVVAPPGDDVTLTIYEQGIAQVDEMRRVPIAAGTNQVIWPGVSAGLVVDSVMLTGADTQLLGWDLREPNLTQEALMRANLGKVVDLDVGSADNPRSVPAKLISLRPQVVVEVDGALRVLSGADRGKLRFDRVPEGLSTERRLSLTLDGPSAGETSLALRYLRRGLDWRAGFRAVLSEDGSKLRRLAGHAIVTHGGEENLSSVALRLVSGALNTRQGNQPQPRPLAAARAATLQADAVPESAVPTPTQAGLTQVYTIPGRVTLQAGGIKDIDLFRAQDIAVQEHLIAKSRPVIWGPEGRGPSESFPTVELRFKNDGRHLDGLPWPRGTLWLYRETADGLPVVAGSANLPYLPEGAEAKLTLGQANDVKVSRTQTSFKRLDPQGRRAETSHEIRILNGSKTQKTVDLIEVFGGEWSITDSSHTFTAKGAEARWPMTVAPGDDVTVRYTVQVTR